VDEPGRPGPGITFARAMPSRKVGPETGGHVIDTLGWVEARQAQNAGALKRVEVFSGE